MPLASQITGGRICKSGIKKLLKITYVIIFGSSRLFDLRTIVFDHPRLIRSNLICCCRARMRCWGWTDPCTQCDASVRPAHVLQVHWCIKHANMQCVCWTPFIWATVTINSPSEAWLFVFGHAVSDFEVFFLTHCRVLPVWVWES